MTDHDQRFKILLKEFLAEFFQLFFAEWAQQFDFSKVEWLEQEVFPDPPEGKRRALDLVAKLPTHEPVGRQTADARREWVSLIHVEIESADSVATLRRYMFRAYANLRDRYDLPVLPLGVYLNVGLDGLGTDSYREFYGSLNVLTFEYLYVGLRKLNALEYVEGENDLGVALSALMNVPRGKRVWLRAEALLKLARSPQNEQRKFLLAECVEAYLPLEEESERDEYERLLAKEEYREAKAMAMTSFEQGLEQGREQGLQSQRELLALLLEERFGPLSLEVRQRVSQWPADGLSDLARKIVHAGSLSELGLEE